MLHGAESIGIARGGASGRLGPSDRVSRRGAPRRTSPRRRSTIAATTGSVSSPVRVRSVARNSSANARLFVPGGQRVAAEDVEQHASAQQVARRFLERRLHGAGGDVVGNHERQVAADRREPRRRRAPRPCRRRSGSRARRHRARPPRPAPSRSSCRDHPRVQLAHDAHRRVAGQHGRRAPGVERMPGRHRRATTSARRARPSAPRGPPWRRARRTAGRRRPSPRPPGPAARTRHAGAPRRGRREPEDRARLEERDLPRRRAPGCGRPRAASPGRSRVRRNASSACSGFATGTASASPGRSRGRRAEANESRPHLAQPGAHQGLDRSRAEARTPAAPRRPARRRHVRADAVVAVEPRDLLDQVDLALDVDPVAGHLDLDPVDAAVVRGRCAIARRSKTPRRRLGVTS